MKSVIVYFLLISTVYKKCKLYENKTNIFNTRKKTDENKSVFFTRTKKIFYLKRFIKNRC